MRLSLYALTAGSYRAGSGSPAQSAVIFCRAALTSMVWPAVICPPAAAGHASSLPGPGTVARVSGWRFRVAYALACVAALWAGAGAMFGAAWLIRPPASRARDCGYRARCPAATAHRLRASVPVSGCGYRSGANRDAACRDAACRDAACRDAACRGRVCYPAYPATRYAACQHCGPARGARRNAAQPSAVRLPGPVTCTRSAAVRSAAQRGTIRGCYRDAAHGDGILTAEGPGGSATPRAFLSRPLTCLPARLLRTPHQAGRWGPLTPSGR